MTSWLSDLTGIHISPHRTYINRDQLGRALKVAAPIAGAFMGPLGVALGGIGGGLGRGMQHGANFGDILGAGVMGAGEAYGLGKLRSAFGGVGAGGSTAGSAAGDVTGAADAASGAADIGLPSGDIGASTHNALGGLFGGRAGDIGGWLKEHPSAVSGGLSAITNYGRMKSEGELAQAQMEQLRQQTEQQRTLEEERKKRMASLAPLIQMYSHRISTTPPPQVAGNPYLAGGNPFLG